MKTPSPLLFASTALTMALALPAFAASPSEGSGSGLFSSARSATMPGDDDANPMLIRVSDDEDDDHRGWERRGHDDDDDECEDGRCRGAGGRGNPSPVGTVAPPANGLFGNGALPKAVTN